MQASEFSVKYIFFNNRLKNKETTTVTNKQQGLKLF